MGIVDLTRLREPFPEGYEPTDEDGRLALGIRLPHWSMLQDEISGDLVKQSPFGIGWWALDPGMRRRLIADQLISCVESVPTNLTEARLHWIEFLDASERDSALYEGAFRFSRDERIYEPPVPRCAFDCLLHDMVRVHQAGVVRAVASTLDCLAGVIK